MKGFGPDSGGATMGQARAPQGPPPPFAYPNLRTFEVTYFDGQPSGTKTATVEAHMFNPSDTSLDFIVVRETIKGGGPVQNIVRAFKNWVEVRETHFALMVPQEPTGIVGAQSIIDV